MRSEAPQRSIEFQKECDMLFITSEKNSAGMTTALQEKHMNISRHRNLFLRLCHLVRRKNCCNRGYDLICDPDNTEESALKMIRLMKGEIIIEPQTDFNKSLSRYALTGKLSRNNKRAREINTMKKKILLIAGTRPNFIKLSPLYHRLKKKDSFEVFICHTGQHFDFNMSDIFWKNLELPEPDSS